MTTSTTGGKTVTYRASLPPRPEDWTLDLIRKFVQDADSQGISGATHVTRFPENDAFALQMGDRYYGLGVERVVNLEAEEANTW